MTCEGILDTEQVGGKGVGCWRGPAGHLLQQLPDHVLVEPQGLLPLLHILCTGQRVGYMPCKSKCVSSTTVGALQIYTVEAKLLHVPDMLSSSISQNHDCTCFRPKQCPAIWSCMVDRIWCLTSLGLRFWSVAGCMFGAASTAVCGICGRGSESLVMVAGSSCM